MKIDLKLFVPTTKEKWDQVDIAHIKLLPSGWIEVEFQGRVRNDDGGSENAHNIRSYRARMAEVVQLGYDPEFEVYRLHLDGDLIAEGKFGALENLRGKILSYLTKF